MIEKFAQHRVAANLTMIMMTLAGIWAIRSMPSQLDPPATFPMVFVRGVLGGGASEVIALIRSGELQDLVAGRGSDAESGEPATS